VIDALAANKDDAGDVEVVHLSNLTPNSISSPAGSSGARFVLGGLIGLGEEVKEEIDRRRLGFSR